MASISLVEIFLGIILYVSLRYLFNKNGLPINWPVMGMVPDTIFHLHRFHDYITGILEQSGCSFCYQGPWFSDVRLLVTADPPNIHYIMSSNFSNFPKGSQFSQIFDILGDGIFNSDSDSWKFQRKLAHASINNPRFHQFLVKTIRDMVEEGLVSVLDHVAEQGSEIDLQDLFQRFTFDITCKLVTGFNPRCLSIEFPQVQFSKAMDDAEEVIFYRHIKPKYLWKLERCLGIGHERKMRKAWRILDDVSAQYISRKRQLIKNQQDGHEEGEVDLLTSYMKTEAEIMGSKFEDDKFLRDTIINFLLAGRDTTSSALTWFFWLISKNPQVENKVREELRAIIPSKVAQNWRIFNPEEVNRLVYLHGALCETLRLYPPVPFEHKVPIVEDVLPSGHRVNSKIKIVISLYAMGRMASIWGEDCLEFKPERWISGEGKLKHEPSYKFMAFNAGPRTCLGKEVAFTQMKTVAAAIIHNYRVQVVEGHPVSPVNASIILHMKHGLKVKVSRRWS